MSLTLSCAEDKEGWLLYFRVLRSMGVGVADEETLLVPLKTDPQDSGVSSQKNSVRRRKEVKMTGFLVSATSQCRGCVVVVVLILMTYI